jgi:hypothetical protein
MMLLDSTNIDVVKWIAERFSIIGWTALIGGVWKISMWVNKTVAKAEKATEQVDKLATEHFPAIKDSLSKQDGYLKSIAENMETLAGSVQFDYVQAIPVVKRPRFAKRASKGE